MAVSPNKEEQPNMEIEYQNKYNKILSNVNTELTYLRDRFIKMESQLFSNNES